MNRFSPDELRRAITALDVIKDHGDPDEWALILREAVRFMQGCGRWGNATPNQQIGGALLAGELSNLLDEDRDRCEQAAADVFAPQRHRAVYDAIVGYADELTGQRSPRNLNAAKPAPRPAVRIVGEERGVA
jgi:hypothetical protein